MSNEWRDLKTLQDVAAAQAAGDEIEFRGLGITDYKAWNGVGWSSSWSYRARPRKPATKKIKMLCFFDGCLLLWQDKCYPIRDGRWKRIPSEDKEIEVQDD